MFRTILVIASDVTIHCMSSSVDKQLDRRINDDYPEIGEMHRIASGMSNMIGIHTEQIPSEYDAILKDLNSDRFGIYISVLLKHGKISCIKEIIESVD